MTVTANEKKNKTAATAKYWKIIFEKKTFSVENLRARKRQLAIHDFRDGIIFDISFFPSFLLGKSKQKAFSSNPFFGWPGSVSHSMRLVSFVCRILVGCVSIDSAYELCERTSLRQSHRWSFIVYIQFNVIADTI